MTWIDHFVEVPLDHSDPGGATIEVYAREVVAPDLADRELPYLLFLQGGPGCRAERPTSTAAWLASALRQFRVVLLDQRGTGRSTPANRQSLPEDGAAAAAYLRNFRADAIVRDSELLRRKLIGDRPWTLLGQSYGGFCAMTYLSLAPEGLQEVLIGGGLPSLTADAEDVYRAAYPRVLAHNDRFFTRHPGDRQIARALADHLAEHEVCLPSGERLTPERFALLGIMFGTTARFDNLHFLLEDAFIAPATLSDVFLRGVDSVVSFADNPLYAVMHESIYCQGTASNWAAHRIAAEFDVPFFGEMIFPWQFAQDPALRPLATCANLLAEDADWPALYDPGQLSRNTIPMAVAIYHDDMYVDREHALQTAAAVRGVRPWITNEHAHDGLACDAAVFDRLLAMARGSV